jgi:hypothetical protein
MSGSLWIGKIPGTTVAPRMNVFCGGGRCCRLIHGRRAVEIARRPLGVNIRAAFMMSGSKVDGDKFQCFLRTTSCPTKLAERLQMKAHLAV